MIGAEQIPSDGPLIICCNHANQFVDASLIIANLKRQPMFIGAAKSFRRPVIG
jgi:glycerol-3-phosphate O-acyltransferase/dihydroxyacetone phosphate acyltransferase